MGWTETSLWGMDLQCGQCAGDVLLSCTLDTGMVLLINVTPKFNLKILHVNETWKTVNGQW